ncbi:hypothetical protein ACWFRK_32450, partial [Streptomyces sp. NPDC055157]
TRSGPPSCTPPGADSAMPSGPDADGPLRTLALTGPRPPMTTAVQISHLGGRPAAEPAVPKALPYRDAACPVRLLPPLDGRDVTAVRELYGGCPGTWSRRPWAGR